MTTQTVLITGALTGIGRAAAIAFARQGNNVVVSGRTQRPARRSPPSCARSGQRPSSSSRTSARMTRCAISSIAPSPVSDASMPP